MPGDTQLKYEHVLPVAQMLAPWALHAALLALGLSVLVIAWRTSQIGPGAFRARTLRNVRVLPPELWFVLAVATFFALLVGMQAAARLSGLNPETTRGQAVISASAYAFSAAVGLWLYVGLRRAAALHRLHDPVSDPPTQHEPAAASPPPGVFGGALLGVPWFLAVIGPVLALSVVATWAHTIFTGAPPPDLAHPTLERIVKSPGDPYLWLLIAGPVLGAPLVEEIVFRLGLQSALLRVSRSPGLAIACSSLAFMGVHVGSVPPHALLPLLGLGVGLGLAFERTRSLATPIAMHAIFNASNIAMALLT